MEHLLFFFKGILWLVLLPLSCNENFKILLTIELGMFVITSENKAGLSEPMYIGRPSQFLNEIIAARKLFCLLPDVKTDSNLTESTSSYIYFFIFFIYSASIAFISGNYSMKLHVKHETIMKTDKTATCKKVDFLARTCSAHASTLQLISILMVFQQRNRSSIYFPPSLQQTIS